MKQYIRLIISQDNFLEQLQDWLLTLEDERMVLLRQFLFEVDLSDTEKLKEILYQYGSLLTEKNFAGRKFFQEMAELLRQEELNCDTVVLS